MAKFRREPPNGASNVGEWKSRFSINISLYIGNDTRYGHSCYGMRIGNRTLKLSNGHFQRRWTIANPDFSVTPLFDAEYLRNGSLRDRDIVAMEYYVDLHITYSTVSFRMTLSDLAKYSQCHKALRGFSATADAKTTLIQQLLWSPSVSLLMPCCFHYFVFAAVSTRPRRRVSNNCNSDRFSLRHVFFLWLKRLTAISTCSSCSSRLLFML